MNKRLSPEEVAQYEREGFLSPLRVFSETEMAGYRRRLDALESELGRLRSAPLQDAD